MGILERAGFTMVEVLVAAVILCVGVLATASVLGTVTYMVSDSRSRTVAATLAAGQLEALRAAGCPEPAHSRTAEGSHTLAWTVDPVPRGRRITVTVTSPGPRAPRTHALVSYVLC